MKKKWLKKGGALLMASTMLLSVFSGTMGTGITAYASENQTTTADGSAIAELAEEASPDTSTDLSSVSGNNAYMHEITNDGSYYLSSDLTSNESKTFLHITGDIDVTIDLKGSDICSNYTGITIDNGARVKITNSISEESKIDYGTKSGIGVLINQNGGSLTLENVTLVEKQGRSYDYPLIRVDGGGNLTVKNVKFDSEGFCIHLKQTGDINIADSTFTVNNPFLDGGGNIIYTDYNHSIGNITVTDSIFNWDKNDGISITTPDHGSVNISGSTFNCSSGISVKGGEVNVSNCTFEGTDKYSLGYAVYMTSVADKENKLTVSGGTCNTRQGGIGVKSVAAKVDLTLKGDIAFNHTSEYGDLVFFDRYDNSSKAQVNLNLGELKTQNLTMALPSIAYEDVIICEYEGAITCDSDYSAKLKARDTKYAVRCAEDNGKYVVKFNERKITTQPTVESPKVEVSDDTDVSFRWYKAGKKEYELKNTASEGVIVPDTDEENFGTYENGVWKPAEFSELEYSAFVVCWNLKEIKGNCTVVIENRKGFLGDYQDSFNVMAYESYEPFDSNVKDGKLYFSGKADGLTISGFEIPQDAELIVKLIVPNDTEALQGQNTNTLTTAQPGDYRCHIIWDEETDYSYEILSDILTITQAITPDEPGKEPEEPTPTPDPEEHTWIYTASGATLTATCSNDNNHNHKATLTLTATNPTYSGDGVTTGWNAGETPTFTLAGEAEWKEALGNDAVPVIKYVGTGSTAYAESETAPTVAGTYKATITKESKTAEFAFEMKEAKPSDDTENILAEAKGLVVSKITDEKFLVSNLTTDKDIKNAIKTALLSDDKTKTVVSEITVTKTAAAIGKAGNIAINVKLSLKDKNITFDLNKVIDRLEGKNITVTVEDGNDTAVSEATVKVKLGKAEKAKGTSAADGSCAFPNLPAGLYNIVITKDGVTKTAIADLRTADAEVSVELDTASKGSSHLTVNGEETPGTGTETEQKPKAATKVEETVVNNLDELAEALKETDAAVNSYKVEMAVEAKAATQVSKSTQSEMVKEANKGETGAENKATNIDFLDIVIQKTITKNSVEQTPELITDTGSTVMEIIIPFNFTGKTKVKVLREHDGMVEKFNDTTTGADGTCKIEKENGLIILYATKFSTYAVSYVAEGESAIEEPATPPAYTGGGSVSVTVPATGITIEADKYEITKEGETVAIKAAIQPSNATDTKLTFTSSDEKVAKVDANGVITAVGNGTATITIKTANDITKTITITVNIPSEENKDDENKDDGNKDDGNKDDGNKDDGNKEESSSPEKEVVTPEKLAANAIAISKGFKVSQKGTKINVSWGKVAGADGYLVYAAYCGTEIGKAVKTVKGPSSVSTTITKLNGKKLDLKKNFKVYVKAYKLVDGKKVTVTVK